MRVNAWAGKMLVRTYNHLLSKLHTERVHCGLRTSQTHTHTDRQIHIHTDGHCYFKDQHTSSKMYAPFIRHITKNVVCVIFRKIERICICLIWAWTVRILPASLCLLIRSAEAEPLSWMVGSHNALKLWRQRTDSANQTQVVGMWNCVNNLSILSS